MLTLRDNLNQDDLAEVLANLCAEDRAEIDAAGMENATSAFAHGMRESTVRGCVYFDSNAVAVFGCMPDPTRDGAGIPWMVATPMFRRDKRRAMAFSREVIDQMREAFPYLHNWVHREHHTAIRWLAWLGFAIDFTPVGPGEQFLHFEWSNACVTP